MEFWHRKPTICPILLLWDSFEREKIALPIPNLIMSLRLPGIVDEYKRNHCLDHAKVIFSMFSKLVFEFCSRGFGEPLTTQNRHKGQFVSCAFSWNFQQEMAVLTFRPQTV